MPGKNIEFEYEIGDIVILRPVTKNEDSIDIFGNRNTKKYVQYRVLSRIYEELSTGDGVICYAVRHIDVESPGGGKIYKFQQDELILYSSFMALLKLTEKKESNEITGLQQAAKVVPPNWHQLAQTPYN